MSDVLKGMLFFVVLAPPIGSLLFSFVLAIASLVASPSIELLYLLPATFSSALFSYLLGGIPALITGAIAGGFRRSLNGRAAYVAIGAVACILSLAFGSVTLLRSFEWPEVRTLFLMFGGPAFFSGTVTAALFRKKPNNSVNPDALTRAG
ncbi:hypothetical protein GTP46_21945 [Duganella sp. FT135W]|uniref:Uncharacterized protein n=1 Tax=Duganella flavida TaxID=2692175 RepID=A0A6L8KF17_9BURK|nr:hypothetical protein [Duganella flavida]MYM25297.1 hypothetical protein [Duganella flavida]